MATGTLSQTLTFTNAWLTDGPVDHFITFTNAWFAAEDYQGFADVLSFQSNFWIADDILFDNLYRGIVNFARTSEGLLIIVNGFDPPLRWDGSTPQAQTAGLAPPPSFLADGVTPVVAMGIVAGSSNALQIWELYPPSQISAWQAIVALFSAFLLPTGASVGANAAAQQINSFIADGSKTLIPPPTVYAPLFPSTAPLVANDAGPYVGLSCGVAMAKATSDYQLSVLSNGGSTDGSDVLPLSTISGTYYAYVRYVDANENFSNLGPLCGPFNTAANNTVTAATNTSPIKITSAKHGLFTGASVNVQDVEGNTAANGTWTVTVTDPNNFYLNYSAGNAAYLSGGTWSYNSAVQPGITSISYTNVPVPTDPRVVRKQILRNTAGQASTFYVDVDTTDLSATGFSSTRTDEQLATQQAVPILNADGSLSANRYGVPPAHKRAIAQIRDRMFMAVDGVYTEGSAVLVDGSLTVQGIGTQWTLSMAGRYLYVPQSIPSGNLIQEVNVAAQTLTLSTAYLGPSDAFALYTIRPAPAERRLVYWSEAGLPEAWPVINAISVPEDGDELTGLMAFNSWLFVLEDRHIYRFSFQDDPATDGSLNLAINRGCANHRCWVQADGIAFMLDQQGAYAFDGSSADPVTDAVQDIWRTDGSPYQINWQASETFHAVDYPAQQCIRWFVSLSASDFPRDALCFDYRRKRWWIEQFAGPIGGSVLGYDTGTLQPRVYLGGDAQRVFAYWQGTLDVVNPANGTTRGTATAAGLLSLTDSAATFNTTEAVGAPLVIAEGTGKGQRRIVSAATTTALTVSQPWNILPDTTSVYQLGGIQWKYQTGWFRWDVPDETLEHRRIEVVWQSVANPATMDVEVYRDLCPAPMTWGYSYQSKDTGGVAVQAGKPDLVVDLTKKSGFAQKRLDGHKEYYADGWRFISVGFQGSSGMDPIRIYQITIDGAAQ
jgi:hypothetical protein